MDLVSEVACKPRRWLIVMLINIAMVVGPACDEPNVKVSVNKDNPPTFEFSGSGYLDFFVVMEIASENLPTSQHPEKNRVLWQIWPKGSAEGQLPLPSVTYGKVPPGFVQKIPDTGVPPGLEEGKVYQAGGPPVVVPRGFVRFTIRNGKVVPIDSSF